MSERESLREATFEARWRRHRKARIAAAVLLTIMAGTLLAVTRAPWWAGFIAVGIVSPVGCFLTLVPEDGDGARRDA